MSESNKTKPEPENKILSGVLPEIKSQEAEKVEGEKKSEDKKKEQIEKVKHVSEKLSKLDKELEEKKKAEQEKKDFLKTEYNYESTSGNPPEINPEDAAVDEHYFGEIKKEREKLQEEAVESIKEKHQSEQALISDYQTLEGLDSGAKLSAEKAIQTEYLRKSLSFVPLDHPTIKGLEEEAKKINPDYENLTSEKKYELFMRTTGAKAKIDAYIKEYNAIKPEKMNDAKIVELAKKHFGIESLSGEEIGVFQLPETTNTLKDPMFVDAAKRGISEYNFQELTRLQGDSLQWNNVPDSIKMAIQFDPYFTMNEEKLPIAFREQLQEMKAQAREERQPNETPEQYFQRYQEAAGATPRQAAEIQKHLAGGRNNMSPFFRALADLLAPIFATFLKGAEREAWQNYMRNNPVYTSGTLAERSANGYGGGGGVGGGGEIQGTMPGYSLDVNGEITETEKQSIQKIHEAFKSKVSDPTMQAKLLNILERHAKNNPNFSANEPFLAHDVGTKQAFVFFPPGEAVVCGATHGYAGVGNVSEGGGTSLGSKRLSKGWDGNGMNSRTIVHGLEECNKNDEQRLIRVHEWRGSGTKTAGCTGLPPEIAERLQQAVITAGGGAQETFNSNTVPAGTPESGQTGENPGQLNSTTEKAKETKEKMTKVISYSEAKRLIESGVQPTDPPTIYKIDMSTYQISDRYRGNTDPSAGEDAANRNLTDKGKEYIAVHGTASSDISGFHMMLESGLFPYFVSTKGLVFQGADDMTTGSCVSTETANPNMDKYGLNNFNNRGIAIEVSLAATGGGGIVRPNEAQKKATQQLINVLRGVHDIGPGNVITSADPVRDLNSGDLLPGAHGDDFIDADRVEMGIARSGDVRNRLKTGVFFSDEMATNQALREAQINSSQEQSNEKGASGFGEFIYGYEARLDNAGKLNVLRGVHDIGPGNVITSADPVRDLNSGDLLPGAHGDDFIDADRVEMGIARSGDVRNRLKTGVFFSDEMATNQALREAQINSSQEQSNEKGASGFGEFIYGYEARLDNAGKLTVYRLPRGDQGGSYEVAGINDKYHPREAAHLASLIRSGKQDQAKQEAMKYIEQFTRSENKVISQNRGVDFMMLDATFHRGGGGSASIASYVLDGGFSDNWDGNKQARWNQLEKQNPAGLIARIKDARRAYEIYKYGRRTQFWAGFESRWDKAQRQANSLA